MQLLLYLLRSPLFDRTTMPALRLASRMIHALPLGKQLGDYTIEVVQGLHDVHFYHANS
ncbi:hypothetical protein EON64_18155 [archaeon]|nr:MAG: hypothetical protein EON64_18155 [archaeon]